MENVLELKGLKKTFGETTVLEDVNIEFREGEFHALVGENGAGKSTIIKAISGVHQPTAGQIVFHGKPVKFGCPTDAQRAGISTLFQEIQEIPEMTVAENIFLGREPKLPGGIFIDKGRLVSEAKKLMQDMGLSIDITKKMRELPVSTRKMVEIARAVNQNASVVIMDEPTANLNAEEINALFHMIDMLKQKRTTIIYISHRMNEIFALADRVTVLRDGRKVATLNHDEYDEKSLISMMIGRELTEMYPERHAKLGEVVLDVKDFTLDGFFKNISFQVKAGEVVGFSGLDSSGATVLTKALFGLTEKPEGTVRIAGENLKMKNPSESIRQHVAYLPEDRKTQGLFLNQNIVYNYTISSLHSIFSRAGVINHKLEKDRSTDVSKNMKLKADGLHSKPNELSGGNQQKVLLGRWMLDTYKLLIMEEPTRGVDVGAKAEIYQQINHLAEQGVAVIMYSTEMMELLGMCDRILVFSAGNLTADLDKEKATQEKIMQHALVR